MSLFSVAIKEARGKASHRIFAIRLEANPHKVKRWEDGVLPGTRSFNRIVKKLKWDKYKASIIADDIERLREREREYKAKKLNAYDRVKDLVIDRNSDFNEIKSIIKETEKFA